MNYISNIIVVVRKKEFKEKIRRNDYLTILIDDVGIRDKKGCRKSANVWWDKLRVRRKRLGEIWTTMKSLKSEELGDDRFLRIYIFYKTPATIFVINVQLKDFVRCEMNSSHYSWYVICK